MFNVDSMAINQKDNIGKRKDKRKKNEMLETPESSDDNIFSIIKKNSMKQIYKYHVKPTLKL
jgi:hypothetical protein